MIWEQNVSQSKRVMIRMSNKMAYTAKDPCPPLHFLYLTETKSWRCEEKGKGENVHLLTHAPTRGVGKKLSQDTATYKLNWFDCIYEWSLLQHREVLQYHSHLLLRSEYSDRNLSPEFKTFSKDQAWSYDQSKVQAWLLLRRTHQAVLLRYDHTWYLENFSNSVII